MTDETNLIFYDGNNLPDDTPEVNYSEDDIRTLSWHEHIRLRPGMYIGKLGDGTYNDDGIYVLIKEVIDNSIDEFMICLLYTSDAADEL